ncbi:hypothetical protein J3459_006704 [Metarhizium acridum]|uniref:uncharacterized protein n=1 Tax=Metarhizium acridum TaxID=92637 RepID=UPI001C6BCFF1|nr:hypothetical protein J3458_004924 [Metarhizium acridum]KAG8427439.1 hypothetical protein J3459_006704 [Metarhizium acridum]
MTPNWRVASGYYSTIMLTPSSWVRELTQPDLFPGNMLTNQSTERVWPSFPPTLQPTSVRTGLGILQAAPCTLRPSHVAMRNVTNMVVGWPGLAGWLTWRPL